MDINTWKLASDHWFCPLNHRHSSHTSTEIIDFSDTVGKVFEGEVDVLSTFLILSFHVVLPQCEDRESRASISITHVLQHSIYLFTAIRLTAEMITTISNVPRPAFKNGSLIRVHILLYLTGGHSLLFTILLR